MGIVTSPLCNLNGSKSSRSIMLAVKTNLSPGHRMSDTEVPSFPFGVKFPSCNKNIILPEFHCKIYFVFIFACLFYQLNLITTAVKFSVDLNRKQENGNTRSPHQSAKQKNFIAYTDFDTIRHHPNSPVLP